MMTNKLPSGTLLITLDSFYELRKTM